MPNYNRPISQSRLKRHCEAVFSNAYQPRLQGEVANRDSDRFTN